MSATLWQPCRSAAGGSEGWRWRHKTQAEIWRAGRVFYITWCPSLHWGPESLWCLWASSPKPQLCRAEGGISYIPTIPLGHSSFRSFCPLGWQKIFFFSAVCFMFSFPRAKKKHFCPNLSVLLRSEMPASSQAINLCGRAGVGAANPEISLFRAKGPYWNSEEWGS